MPFNVTPPLDNCANSWGSWKWEENVGIMTALITQTGSFPERFLSLRSHLLCVRQPPRALRFHSPAVGSLHVGRAQICRLLSAAPGGGERGPFFTLVQVCLTSMATNLCNPRAPCEAVIK